MKRTALPITILLLLFLVIGSWAPYGYGQAVPPQKQAAQDAIAFRLPLSQSTNGVDGYLELRQDARLTAKLRSSLWGMGDINFDDDPDLANFKTEPLRKAVIQVVDRSGKVLESKKQERPLGKLRTTQLYADSTLTYLLTIDYSAGFGSYSGPITELIEVKNGHMRWVEATDLKTGKSDEISLMESLKTAWKLVDAPDGKGKQILLAQCRPNWSAPLDADPDFRITYARFYFNGSKWILAQRTVKGFTEFEEGFPSRKRFP
jgi:hypothetical protein